MNTLGQAYKKLRRDGRKNSLLLMGSLFFSVLMITAFSIIMQSNTVQTILPVGGDSRKQMYAIFALAVFGCSMFSVYASALFFRGKSRQIGILMALGTPRRSLAGLLTREVAGVAAGSILPGLILGAPLAAGIWQAFRRVADTREMVFSIDPSAYLIGLAFSLFCLGMVILQSIAFLRRTNIMDVISEARRSEPIRDVKGWYGPVGLILMVAGAGGAYFMPYLFNYVFHALPPFWVNGLYGLVAVGLYLLLLHIVIRGGGRKPDKNIVGRSMMKFQGRQTVRNMCVLTVLLAGAYFALFYIPSRLTEITTGIDARDYAYAYHYMATEDLPDEVEVQAMAEDYGVEITELVAIDVLTLASDGYDIDYDDDGNYIHDYYERIGEATCMRETDYNLLSGQGVDVEPGGFLYVRREGESANMWEYNEDIGKLTNPSTTAELPIAYGGEVVYGHANHYLILDDADFGGIAQGLTDEWVEKTVWFNVAAPEESRDFALALKNAIIDRSSQAASVAYNYDRVEKWEAERNGGAYWADDIPQMFVSYDERDAAIFADWKYYPQFSVLDTTGSVMNQAVFLMLFAFISLICFAAVAIIGYTRAITIGILSGQMVEDLRRLGASRAFLYRTVKSQISKVFALPGVIGTGAMLLFYAFVMAFNASSPGFSPEEAGALVIDIGLVVIFSAGLWGLYRFTLGRVCRMLGVKRG